jgi:nickel superoxide dismutase
MRIFGVAVKLPEIKPVFAHCDLPCGVYDPAQARIEAQSVLKIQEKYTELDEVQKTRAIFIKEERAELVKRHLCVLWTDYFKPEHLKKHKDLHEKFWLACKQASACKHSVDPEEGEKLLAMIDEIAKIFAATKKEAAKK